MIAEKPVLGIGYGRYNAEFWPYCEKYVQQSGNEIYGYVLREMRGLNPGQMHNDPLEVACETGVIGAAAFIGIWVLALLLCFDTVRRGDPADQRLGRCLRAALLCIFVDSLFGFPLQLPASAVLFWIVLGTVVQTHRRAAQRSATTAAKAAADHSLAASIG
jgi:O-antigen ligase